MTAPHQHHHLFRPRMRLPTGAVPLLAGGGATALGALVTLTWLLGLEHVNRVVPGLPLTKGNAGLGMLGLGLALVLLRVPGPRRTPAGRALAVAVAGLGLAVLYEHLFTSLGIDELLFADASPSRGRVSPHVAVCLLLTGAAVALGSGPRRDRIRQWLLVAAALVVLSALLGLAFEVSWLWGISSATGMGLHAAVALVLVVVGAAFLRPDHGLVGYLRRGDLGAATARALLPVVLGGPLLLGAGHRLAVSAGVPAETALGLTTLAGTGLLLAVVLAVTRRIGEADARREAAETSGRAALTRFAALFHATPDPIVVVGAGGLIESVNASGEEHFGHPAAELVGRPVERLLPDGVTPATSGEAVARCRGGGEVPVEVTARAAEGAVIAAIRDVSERRRAEERMRRVARFFDVTTDLFATAAFDGRFEGFYGAWELVLGWDEAQLRARPFMEFVHPDDRAKTIAEFEQLRTGRAGTPGFRNRYRCSDGRVCWLEWTATSVIEERRIYCSARDVTERVQAEEARRAAETRFTRAFEEAPIGMALSAVDGRFLRVNAALCALTGYTAEQLTAIDVPAVTHPDDVEDAMTARRQMVAGEIDHHRGERRLIRRDGEPVPVEIGITLVRDADGEPSHFISQVLDMSEHKRFETSLQQLADHDPLTGLFNRRRFEAELQRELDAAARYGRGGAVLALDLDDFKVVNDTLGHAAGDELIAHIAAVLRERLRRTDVLARLGGDEFAVVLPHARTGEALVIAEDVLRAVRDHGQAGGGRRVSASIGVATYGADRATSPADVMVEADIAMYDAKEAGRDRVALFDRGSDRHERLQTRLTWADRVRDALAHDRFRLHAQPIVGLGRDDAPRYELLVRMACADGTLALPGAFLGVAERFDLVRPLDRWVVREAVALLAEQQRAGSDVRLSVNLSARSVTDPDMLAFIDEQLRITGARPGGLCLEVTETAAIANMARATAFARSVKELGCEVALDDFGAGFASFSYLKHLDFDYLKIDGEFISDLARNPVNQLLVRALVEIARGLEKRTIAEFVSDAQTMACVRGFGIDFAQGFHIARPGPIVAGGTGEAAQLPRIRPRMDERYGVAVGRDAARTPSEASR